MKEIYKETLKSYKTMILSASGWRMIFAADKNENSMNLQISQADKILTAGIGVAFSRWAISKGCKTSAVGRDARPTGKSITEIVIKAMLKYGLGVKNLSVAAAPEIMSYVKENTELDSFIYISASHNPAGHNGVKFGLGDGAVIGGKDSEEIIALFKKIMENLENYPELEQIANNPLQISESKSDKEKGLDTYFDFNIRTAFPKPEFLQTFKKLKKPGIIADMNGSARTVSIDHQFFTKLEIKHEFINNKPGEIVHGILPEGKNLAFAAEFLEKKYAEDSCFTIGYMPDNDGDRGNLVFIDTNTGKAMVPDAQTVFALTCAAELSFMEYAGMLIPGKTAVAVNCPTSLRIEEICKKFDVKIFRAEVGEANVVNLAAELRTKGYIVRFLGEGSNGGNITYPATVRDPLNTIISIIKFISVPEILAIWRKKSGTELNLCADRISFTELISTLPQFTTTATDDVMAKLHIKCTDHGILKNCYEKIFLKEWNEKKDILKDEFEIYSWKEINTIGTSSIEGMGPEFRAKGIKGGLKILFSNNEGKNVGYLWMRGSGTEPVFRISADIIGKDKSKERFLINWQKEMTEKADITALQIQDRS